MIAHNQELLQVCCACWGVGWPCDEVVVEVVDEVCKVVVVLEDPLQGLGVLVKEVRCRAQAKGEAGVKIVLTLPAHSQQWPVLLADWDHAKGRLEIGLYHECTRTQENKNAYRIIHRGVLKGEGVLLMKSFMLAPEGAER